MMNGLPEICQWLLKRKNIQFTLSGSDVQLLKDFIRMYQELQKQVTATKAALIREQDTNTCLMQEVAKIKQEKEDLDKAWTSSFDAMHKSACEIEKRLETEQEITKKWQKAVHAADADLEALRNKLYASENLTRMWMANWKKEERLKLDAQEALVRRDAVDWKKETTDSKFKIGDTVKLKSGSALMTVTAIYDENRASLSWWWDGKMNHLTLDAECLVKA